MKTHWTGRTTLVVVMIGAACACAPGAFADGRVEGRRGAVVEHAARVQENLRRAVRELELTEAQVAELKKIFETEREALRDLRDDESLTRRQKLEALRALRQEVLEAVAGVLTPEQLEQWKAMREAQRDALRERVRGE